MATVGDWSAATLCTYSQVKAEWPDVDDLTGEDAPADQQDKVEAKITVAKDRIGNRLTADLRDRIYSMGLDATVDIRDYIANPEVFQDACVALTLNLLFSQNVLHEEDMNATKAKYYKIEFKEHFTTAKALVEFDSDDDAEIDDLEASKSSMGYRLSRV